MSASFPKTVLDVCVHENFMERRRWSVVFLFYNLSVIPLARDCRGREEP